MIEDLGIAEPADVGYYSGMVDSAFSFAQLFTVSQVDRALNSNARIRTADSDNNIPFFLLLTWQIYFWSSLSDRIGRKPVIMLGVAGAALSSGCFGFSRSLPAMLISRSLAGGLSGNVAVVSSMLSELTDETNQGKGQDLMPPSRNK